MVDGVFDLLTCKPKLTIKAPNDQDYIDLETKRPDAQNLFLEISKRVNFPYQFPQRSKTQLVDCIFRYVDGTWAPLGLPASEAAGRITFSDSNSEKVIDLFGIISTWPDPYEYEPLLATNVGMVVQKDFAAGGFLSTQQGEVWIGHGRHSSTDVPKIIMMHSGYDTLYLRKFNEHGVSDAANLNLGKLEIQSQNNKFAVTAGDSGLNQDTFLIPQNPSQGGLGLGTVAYPFKWVDATTVFTNGINSLSGGAISVYVSLDCNTVIHGGGSSGDAFKVGDDIYIVDVNNANRLSLQGAQSRTQAGIQFGSGGMWLYRDSAYLRCSSGFVADGTVAVGTYASGGTGSAVYFNSSHQLCQGTSLMVYKTNIETLDDASWIYSLRPVTFDWKDDKDAQLFGRQIGLVAEEVQPIAPLLTFNDVQTGKLQGVIYEKLAVPMLVELQKLRHEVDELKTKLAA